LKSSIAALAQELWVRHDSEIGVRTKLADDALDLVAGADRNVDLLTTTVKPSSASAMVFVAA